MTDLGVDKSLILPRVHIHQVERVAREADAAGLLALDEVRVLAVDHFPEEVRGYVFELCCHFV